MIKPMRFAMLAAAHRNVVTEIAPPPMPQGIPATEGNPFRMMGVSMKFARNTEIYGESDPAEFAYWVVAGAVRTSKLLSDGRRQISAFHFSGEMFGLEAGEEHAFAAEAITDAVVLVVKRKTMMAEAERDPDVARTLWQTTSRSLRRAQEHMLVLGRKNAAERVASFLVDMADRQGGSNVSLPMSRYDIADYLGLTIETVSRTFTQLESSGAISLQSARALRLTRPDALRRMGE